MRVREGGNSHTDSGWTAAVVWLVLVTAGCRNNAPSTSASAITSNASSSVASNSGTSGNQGQYGCTSGHWSTAMATSPTANPAHSRQRVLPGQRDQPHQGHRQHRHLAHGAPAACIHPFVAAELPQLVQHELLKFR